MENDKGKLRRDDFKTGIVLILLSLAVLWEATSYPMTDSYGGVQNVWYVSPALFPIIIGLILLVLALVLVGNAIVFHGLPNVWREKNATQRDQGRVDVRFIGVIIFFSAFVYAYIPDVDFYIASAFFLFAFISGYYLERKDVLIITIIFYILIAVALFIVRKLTGDQIIHWLTDGLTTFGLFCLFLILHNAGNEQADYYTKLRRTLFISLLVPAILCPIFRFGLLVPLPSEGIYIELMEQVKYLFRPNS
ncbi:MAG: tripartite tricarboxylate transporter TctB family protein [Sedimenticola sp.]|nr:tripartite tricarboxylate transporter TctB family protein [Sedimenticola sp.]